MLFSVPSEKSGCSYTKRKNLILSSESNNLKLLIKSTELEEEMSNLATRKQPVAIFKQEESGHKGSYLALLLIPVGGSIVKTCFFHMRIQAWEYSGHPLDGFGIWLREIVKTSTGNTVNMCHSAYTTQGVKQNLHFRKLRKYDRL